MATGFHVLHVDLETFSSVDITKSGLYKYVQSSDFEILLLAYSFDGAPVEVLQFRKPEEEGMHDGFPLWLENALKDPNVIKVAHNAAFEWYCFCRFFRWNPMREGLTFLRSWRCSMVHAQYCGYPASLSDVGKAMGMSEDKKKLATGKALIKYFCVPCKPTKANGGRTRNFPWHDPEKWHSFVEYNRQDVVAEMDIERRLSRFPVPMAVWEQWFTDMAINVRGARLDMEMAEAAIAMDNASKDALVEEAKAITNFDKPNSVSKLVPWLSQRTGIQLENLRKETVTDLMADGSWHDEAARRMLEIRQELGKTSVSKYQAMERSVCADGRVRGVLRFYGAGRTGRWAGAFVQPQNLPRTHLGNDLIPLARELVIRGDTRGLELVFGSVADTLSQLVRSSFVAAPGCMFVDADFSAIEARTVAWLAGEEWALEVFRTTGKIYEMTASQMFHVPMEKIKKGNPEYELRQKGKTAVLGCGYGSGVQGLIKMGAVRAGLTEDELPDIIDRWRQANPHIVDYWGTLQAAAMRTIQTGARLDTPDGKISFALEGDEFNSFMTIRLPSGRKLYYVNPHMTTDQWGRPSIGYWGVKGGAWTELETYGGKLTENIVQAVARDLLAEAVERLTAAGFPIVFHVHDEVVAEVPAGTQADLDRMVEIMSQNPPWSAGLPLGADGWVAPYFKKE